MEIRNFITFKEIVETGSFTGAAKKLHYAQSTITSHVQALEESMGVPLFDRVGKKAILTEIGREVYTNTLDLLDIYHKIEDIPRKEKDIEGEIRIGTPESLMIYKLSPILKEFKETYPLVNFSVSTDTCTKLREKILKGDIDIAFNLDIKMEHPNLIFEDLKEEEMRLIFANAIDNIEQENKFTVLYTEKGCSYRNIFEKYLEKRNIDTRNQIETASVELIKEYSICGIGVSFIPLYAIQKEIEEGKINSAEIENTDPLYTKMLYNKNKWIFPALEKFMELVRERII